MSSPASDAEEPADPCGAAPARRLFTPPRRSLYVVDEARTFLPPRRAPGLGSGIELVSQGRKYGLGMIVVTQVPLDIHNQIVPNCAPQFFGQQNLPATLAAAQGNVAASGGTAADIGKLGAGESCFATEGSRRPAELRTPLCPSFHPANPPTTEEGRRRAWASADGAPVR